MVILQVHIIKLFDLGQKRIRLLDRAADEFGEIAHIQCKEKKVLFRLNLPLKDINQICNCLKYII